MSQNKGIYIYICRCRCVVSKSDNTSTLVLSSLHHTVSEAEIHTHTCVRADCACVRGCLRGLVFKNSPELFDLTIYGVELRTSVNTMELPLQL